MSIALSSLILKNEAKIQDFTRAFRDNFFERVQESNMEGLTNSLSIVEYDLEVLRENIKPSTFYEHALAKVEELPHLIHDPKLNFYEIDNKTYIIFRGTHYRIFKEIKTKLNHLIEKDYSYYNATDEQITSGEITSEEFESRGKFWRKYVNDFMPYGSWYYLYGAFDPRNNYKTLAHSNTAPFPSLDTFKKYADEHDLHNSESRLKAIAKNRLLDKLFKENKEENNDNIFAILAQTERTLRENNYEGWEKELKGLPKELPPLFP